MSHIKALPESQQTAKAVAGKLQDELENVVERFIADNPHLPVAVLIGVLRTVEHNIMQAS